MQPPRDNVDTVKWLLGGLFVAGVAAFSLLNWQSTAKLADEIDDLTAENEMTEGTYLTRSWMSGEDCVEVRVCRNEGESVKAFKARFEAEVAEMLEAFPKTGEKG
jgi:hypothetical protein